MEPLRAKLIFFRKGVFFNLIKNPKDYRTMRTMTQNLFNISTPYDIFLIAANIGDQHRLVVEDQASFEKLVNVSN
jgi:hypothetical protein